MAYSKKTWADRVSEYPNRRLLTPISGETNTYDAARAEGTIMKEGDALNAANLNDLEQRIADEFATKGAAGGVMGLPPVLPATGALLKMAAGGVPAAAVESTDYVNGHYGTWTPVLSAGSDTAPTYTTSELKARYYRIGRLVFIQATIRATITNAGTGYAYITGLPFTISSADSHFCSLNMAECYGLLDKTAPAQAMIDSNHNWIQLFAAGGGSAAKWVATSGGMSFAGCYLTD